MKIFVRSLPLETSPIALEAFANSLLAPPWYLWFRRRIHIKSCVVLKIRDLDSKSVEFHGLLDIMPYKSALDAIQLLNQSRFRGKLLEVRKWHERSDIKDRRAGFLSSRGWSEGERRSRDRRRSHLVVEIYEPPQFRGLRQFHREFG